MMEPTTLHQQERSDSNQPDIDRALEDLTEANRMSVGFSVEQRIQLTEQCLQSLSEAAPEWVALSCQAKQIPEGSRVRAEEVLAGPVSVARFLQILLINLKAVRSSGEPFLPGAVFQSLEKQQRVPVFPTIGLYDAIVFSGLKAEAWLKQNEESASLFNLEQLERTNSEPLPLTLVLGAGNVSAIPATDVLTKILQEGERVLLKMNPVNAYLKPVFEQAFKPLMDEGLLRIVCGDARDGAYLVEHPSIDRIHITGSTQTHDAIVWGSDPTEQETRKQNNQPRINVPITSELGNVSPWIVVPGEYSEKQLRFQAENIAASIANNASFNCLATKVIVIATHWQQRDQFLSMIQKQLDQIPRRYAYYPGAAERWERFAGEVPDDKEYLPWKLIRDADPQTSPQLFREESFVCVCAETGLEADSDTDFLEQAVNFVNQEVWGTLCATITVPNQFQKSQREFLDHCVSRLHYGAVGINHWPALNYAFMSTPWGGAPGGDLKNVASGMGNVHNTYFLRDVEKTVLYGPLTLIPKPVWFPSHPNPESVGWQLLKLYTQPSLMNLSRVGLSVLFK
ncbi:aldehyde dehydrogenase family protein [Gimesia aquarii]|uniref:Aldehyde dehydrogenase family protein n=1 Tax=Gimesia aquarii TaxID=2527964 RepID=A0A517X283_9PLAN|nr:aldehyde dehydrogenase family protein [Gimesia aquarii]QDU11606.1 Aldehyde dehydrogenase family protein [Gimesia aquarii]